MKSKYVFLFIYFFLLKFSFGEWLPEKIYNPFIEVKDVIKTPHIVWAKPYFDGKLKVLVIGPAWGQRESVELMQRFDLDISVLMTHTYNLLSSGNTYGYPMFWSLKNVTDEFDKKLKEEYDVIIIGKLEWDKILTKYRYEILRKVYNGTGFIYVSPPNKNKELDQLFEKGVISDINFLLKGIPFNQLTSFKNQDMKNIIKCGIFGNGRWISLNYQVGTNQILTPNISPYYKNDWEYEYYMTFLYKMILWAGKKEKGFDVKFNSEKIYFDDLPEIIKIEVENKIKNIEDLNLNVFLLRMSDGEIINLGDFKNNLIMGKQSLKIELPLLSEGDYIANFIFKEKEKTIDFVSYYFKVETENKIEEIKLEKENLKSEETLSGSIILNKNIPKDYSLEVKFYDNFGRLLIEKKYSNENKKEIPFNFNVGTPYKSCIHYLEATLKKNNFPVSFMRKKVSITGREKPSFSLAIWTEPQTDYISKIIHKRYYEIGIDSRFINIGLLKEKGLAEVIAESNLFTLPPFPHYWGREIEVTEKGPIHKKCLHNPEFTKERIQMAEESAKIYSLYDILVYGDGSDRSLGGLCFCDWTLNSFREWLKKRYRNISELNKNLKTNFTDWNEIIPDTLEKAKEKNNYSLWVEFVRFMEESYVEDIKVTKGAINKFDPESLVGIDGYGRLDSSDGADWWKILDIVGYYNLYTYQDPPQLEITRSLSKYFPNVKYRTIYYGSYVGQFENETFMKYIPWYALFHNYNGLYWWTADGKISYPCANGGIISPDLRITYPFYLSLDGIKKIKDGIYHLIDGGERDNCGIAIHYSKTAIYAAEAYKSPEYYVASLSGFEKILEDLGYQYDYITTEQIEKGILKNFKVLILPFTLALSDQEAKSIEKFVEDGGTLISYGIPGVYNYYLQKNENGSLLKNIIGNSEEMFYTGKGSSFIIDKDITEYPKFRNEKKGREIRKLLYDLFKEVKIEPIVKIKEFDENIGIPEVEVISYKKGEVKILSFINYRDSKIEFNFEYFKDKFVYDIFEKKLIKKDEWVNVNLNRGEVKIYGILPSFVKKVIFDGPNEVKLGERYIFNVYTQLDSNIIIPSSYRYVLFNPDKEENELYAGVISNKKEEKIARGIIPFALNDLAGKWKLEVTDLISGLKVEKEIQVKKW